VLIITRSRPCSDPAFDLDFDLDSQETLSEEVLGKMHGGGSLKPKYPIITPNDLKEL
jgi:hypothetical protein